MSGVDLPTAPFKSDLIIITVNSEKGKLLSVGKDHRACFADASASNPLAGTARPDFAFPARRDLKKHFSLVKVSLWAHSQPAKGSFNPALEWGDSMDVVLKNWRVLAIVALAFPFTSSVSLASETLYAADNLTDFPTSGIVQVNTGSLLETGDFLTSGAIAGVATDGTNVFVSLPTGISEYTTAGAFVGSFSNEPGDSFGALALAGETLYAADNLTNFPTSGIVEVNTGSLLETGDFLTSGAIAGVATDGTDVFVSLPTGISEYTTAGAFVGSFTNEPGNSFGALALAGGTLYAADNLTNFPTSGIIEVNTGSLLETGDFLTSGAIAGVATDGTDVFVSLPTGISEYTKAGAFVGSFLNEPGDSFGALAPANNVSPAAPEAPTWAMMALGFAGLSFAGYWRTRTRSASSGSNSAAAASPARPLSPAHAAVCASRRPGAGPLH